MTGPKIETNVKSQGSATKLHFTPRKKFQSMHKVTETQLEGEDEESKLPLSRLQKIEKLIQGELPKKMPNIAAINAKKMRDRQSLLERMRPPGVDDCIFKPVLD